MNEQQLDKAISQLASQIAPQRDLWSDIAAQLETVEQQPEAPTVGKSKPKRWYWGVAAMLGLLSVFGWQQALMPGTTSTTAAMPSAELTLLQIYEQQKATQLSQMVAVAEGFDNWQQQIRVWDQAIAQVRQALAFYPDEPQLLAQLQSLYQQQLSYLQQATLQQPLVIS
ncbi:flagellar biosynthesis chaperone FliJ [Rheinheimera pacifica]|uniref:hypothetical protein n=1 Tax=Rheinheimera pacifica TaxID=173990 RepID=UPI002168F646|nr:hypothetical protein [Rheinheimera pacifica]MCS4308512.1 flagellar biosynthesis chaperone FliJ [Rheinheimera pacifica]